MKYYLVNYLILDKKTITENKKLGISLHSFASNEELRKSIAALKKTGSKTDNIVIKSYKQITREAFQSFVTNNE